MSACEKGRSWEMALHVFGSLAKEKPCTLTLCNYMRGKSPFQKFSRNNFHLQHDVWGGSD